MSRNLAARVPPVPSQDGHLFAHRPELRQALECLLVPGARLDDLMAELLEEGLERRGHVRLTPRSLHLLERAKELSGLSEAELLIRSIGAKYSKLT